MNREFINICTEKTRYKILKYILRNNPMTHQPILYGINITSAKKLKAGAIRKHLWILRGIGAIIKEHNHYYVSNDVIAIFHLEQ